MKYLIDILITLIFVFYIIDGYRHGFIKNSLELLGFILSLFVAYIVNEPMANFLISNLPLPLSFSKIVAFLIIWLLVDIVYSISLFFVYRTVPEKIKTDKINKIFGIIPNLCKCIIIVSLVLLFLSSLPIKESIKFKNQIQNTFIARVFLSSYSRIETPYQIIFGKGIDDLVNFFTLPPQSDKIVALNYSTQNLKIDEAAENKMLELINQERQTRGIPELVVDKKLQEIARNHSKDMFSRGYFSHYTPEGLSPFDRIRNANIIYIFAGENLALAPDVKKANQGLMDSQGHRENILNPSFRKVGIGVIDAGAYGKMFAQEFTN